MPYGKKVENLRMHFRLVTQLEGRDIATDVCSRSCDIVEGPSGHLWPMGKTTGYERGETALRRLADKVLLWLPKRWEAVEIPRGKAADEHKAFSTSNVCSPAIE